MAFILVGEAAAGLFTFTGKARTFSSTLKGTGEEKKERKSGWDLAGDHRTTALSLRGGRQTENTLKARSH